MFEKLTEVTNVLNKNDIIDFKTLESSDFKQKLGLLVR